MLEELNDRWKVLTWFLDQKPRPQKPKTCSWSTREKEYFEKDQLMEDLIEDFEFECGSDSNDNELLTMSTDNL